MIVSYRDKRRRDLAAGKRINAFSGFARSARLKLDRLEAANSLPDLAALPGNRFEALRGDRNGQSVSTISAGFALFAPTMHPGLQTWRLLTITRRIDGHHRYSSR
jgi:plasmid maintenance system killer protein